MDSNGSARGVSVSGGQGSRAGLSVSDGLGGRAGQPAVEPFQDSSQRRMPRELLPKPGDPWASQPLALAGGPRCRRIEEGQIGHDPEVVRIRAVRRQIVPFGGRAVASGRVRLAAQVIDTSRLGRGGPALDSIEHQQRGYRLAAFDEGAGLLELRLLHVPEVVGERRGQDDGGNAANADPCGSVARKPAAESALTGRWIPASQRSTGEEKRPEQWRKDEDLGPQTGRHELEIGPDRSIGKRPPQGAIRPLEEVEPIVKQDRDERDAEGSPAAQRSQARQRRGEDAGGEQGEKDRVRQHMGPGPAGEPDQLGGDVWRIGQSDGERQGERVLPAARARKSRQPDRQADEGMSQYRHRVRRGNSSYSMFIRAEPGGQE
jgi:hypothetical protein